jgi:hypothetical protein
MLTSMPRKPAPSAPDSLDALALEEVQRLTRQYGARRQVITHELAELFARRARGEKGEIVFNERDKLVRARMRNMLNGHAPEELKETVPALNREAELLLEREAIDGVLDLLRRAEIPATAAASVRWVEQHGSEWRELAREILLTALRLRALEMRAVAMVEEIPGRSAHGLALSAYVARDWSLATYPQTLDEAAAAALDEKIVTGADLRAAEEVR